MTEKEFLENYSANDYEHPSVAVDVVVLGLDKDFKLNVLLTKRDQQPFEGCSQLPGGFVAMDKTLEECAFEKITEKTGLPNVHYLEQLFTYGEVNRDPRTRVISVVYYAVVRQGYIEATKDKLNKNSYWTDVRKLVHHDTYCPEKELAFDHRMIIEDALRRIAGQVEYRDIAFEFLETPYEFTLFEMNRVYELLYGYKIGLANFRRDFLKRYSNKVSKLDNTSTEFSKRPSALYSFTEYS